MALLSDRLSLNIAGRYYVDTTCIDCDQCRAMAPEFFKRDDDSGMSYVHRQPENGEEMAKMQEAIDACATGSIGDDGV